MRKLLLLFIINIYTVSYSQIIEGTILDLNTKKPIVGASVYINRTFVGTSSDLNGEFKLDVSKYKSMQLIISSIGYYSKTITDFSRDKKYTVYLTPKIYEIKEVVLDIKKSKRKRKRNLKRFKNEFLGTTFNAIDCKIINEKDISFITSIDNDTIKAFASKPILIHNNSLGYKVTYYLDKFEYYKKSQTVFFYGSIIFNEDLSLQNKAYEIKRRKTYNGSRMHFFRSLWLNKLPSSGFVVKSLTNNNIKRKEIVFKDKNDKTFFSFNKEKLKIEYWPNVSYITFNKVNVYFDENGYFDPSGIIWRGGMGEQRIADWLPYEYCKEK